MPGLKLRTTRTAFIQEEATPDAKDATMIAAVQNIEHYEIVYTAARRWIRKSLPKKSRPMKS